MTRHLLKFLILTALVLLPGSVVWAQEIPIAVGNLTKSSPIEICLEIDRQIDTQIGRLCNQRDAAIARANQYPLERDQALQQQIVINGNIIDLALAYRIQKLNEAANNPWEDNPTVSLQDDPYFQELTRSKETNNQAAQHAAAVLATNAAIIEDERVKNDPPSACNFSIWSPDMGEAFACIGNALTPVFSWLVWASTYLLNVAINISVLQFKSLAEIQGITMTWTILRDALNIVFIAALIYAGIGTILGLKSANWQSTVVNVIIAALLINFSMVFAKIIIDVSNILSLTFYYGAAETGSTQIGGAPDIASQIVKALAFDAEASGAGAGAILIGIFGNILIMMLTAVVLFVAACMFIVRSVVLIFLLVLSPVAFMGNILPFLKTYEGQWWGELRKQCIIAPVYLFLFFVTIKMITAGGGINTALSNTGAAGAFIYYSLILGMLIFALIAAQKVGAAGFKFATQTGGAAAFGGAGWLGRKVLGNSGAALMRSERLKARAAQGGFGGAMARGVLYSGAAATKSTFDLRGTDTAKKLASTTGVGFGQASKSTFDKDREAREKKAEARAKLFAPQTDLEKEMVKAANEAFINDPANQEKLQKLKKLVDEEEKKIKDSEEYKAKHGDKLSVKTSEVKAREAELDAEIKKAGDKTKEAEKELAAMKNPANPNKYTEFQIAAQQKIINDMRVAEEKAKKDKNTDKQLNDLKKEEVDLKKEEIKYVTEKLKNNKDYKEKEFMLARGMIDKDVINGFSDDKEGKKAKDEYIKAQGDKEKKFVSGDYFKEQYAEVLATGKAAVIPFTGEMPFGIPYVARSAREQAAAVRAKIGGKSKAQQLEDELRKEIKKEADEEAKAKETEEKTKPSDE